jgi:hypothetical protein
MNWFKSEQSEPYVAPEVEEPQTYDYKVTVIMKDGTVKSFLADFSYDIQGRGMIACWQDVLLDGKKYVFYVIPTSEIKEVMEQEYE